ncbi:hypothetical protein ACHAXS_005146 [Conticribra weissflogii]
MYFDKHPTNFSQQTPNDPIALDRLKPYDSPPRLRDGIVPLPEWIDAEPQVTIQQNGIANANPSHREDDDQAIQSSLLRRTTVALGVIELVKHAKERNRWIFSRPDDLQIVCSVDNFAICISDGRRGDVDRGWEVAGVEMKSPRLRLSVIAPSFSRDVFDGDEGGVDAMGKHVEVQVDGSFAFSKQDAQGMPQLPDRKQGPSHGSEMDMKMNMEMEKEKNVCHILGQLIYEIFLPTRQFHRPRKFDIAYDIKGKGFYQHTRPVEVQNDDAHSAENNPKDECREKKKTTPRSELVPLTDLGLSSPLWSLVENLIQCHPEESHPSLPTASEDLRLMLRDPERFLFPRKFAPHPTLDIRKGKLYGRAKESSAVADAFCRVASTGESEAFLLGGWSGCGKSTLVESVFETVTVAGGYVVSTKFDDISRESPLTVVLSAFDELSLLLVERMSDAELHLVRNELVRVFGINLPKLARILPNVKCMFEGLAASFYLDHRHVDDGDLNFKGICFAIQCFMRIVSSKSRPVVIFLDDLQWADTISLELMHSVLSDIKEASTVLFVGAYRSNEVQRDHPLYRFLDNVESYGVEITEMELDGIGAHDLNAMIADALTVFPRMAKTLSAAVFRKTRGNPLFALEFLDSLIKRNHLQYSLRERRWIWDEKAINEEDLSDNVLHLLTTKLISLPPDKLEALKVASCFGSQITDRAVAMLSKSRRFDGLEHHLDDSFRDGFLMHVKACSSPISRERSPETATMKFPHDKVREAAYGLIDASERCRYHHDIGMALLSNMQATDDNEDEDDEILFSTVHHINRSVSLLLEYPPETRISMVELNLKAGSKAIQCSYFVSAYSYLKIGVELLPTDSWKNQCKLCADIHFLLSRAAYALGKIEDASQTLKGIIEKMETVELNDKLDIYFLYIRTLHAKRELGEAFKTCRWVLNQLGENVLHPDIIEDNDVTATVDETFSMYSELSDSDLSNMKESMNPVHIAAMRFWSQLVFITYQSLPRPLIHYYICKWAQCNLADGFCVYSPTCLSSFACTVTNWIQNTQQGYRIGKMAVKTMNRFDVVADSASLVYMSVYSTIATLVEPFQACADMLGRGSELALSKGDSVMAAANLVQMIPLLLFGGLNLTFLKQEIVSQLTRENQNSQKAFTPYLLIFQDTLSVLVGDQEALSPTMEADLLDKRSNTVPLDYLDCLSHLRLMSSYWLGQYERAKHYAEKKIGKGRVQFRIITSEFYYGLTLIGMYRRKNKNALIRRVKKSMATVKDAAKHSQWNFENKFFLLKAELASISDKNDEAVEMYGRAINSAERSKFIHEQGLASELAGFHYCRDGDEANAMKYFCQARECYGKWGSQMKVDFIDKQIQEIRNRIH